MFLNKDDDDDGDEDDREQEKMTGQRGKLRALVGICHVYESYF